jgi:hypothetical protein
MKMNDLYRTLLVICVLAGVGWGVVVTSPETDNCTPNLIARYTNVIISHQECIALGMQCYIIPRDIEKFHSNQLQLQECITKLVERATEDDSL